MEHDHDHDQQPFDHHDIEKKPQNKVVWVIWNAMFLLFYPVLAAFSLLMMVLMFVSSSLSRVIFWIANLFKKGE